MAEIYELHPTITQSNKSTSSGQMRRAEALRAALETKASFSPDDQMLVAQNLHALLEELQNKKGVRKLDVVQLAGLGGEGTDSTKRLNTYTLPETASQSRRDGIAKKSVKYFDFAHAIAECLSCGQDEILFRIFEGCSYGTGASFENAYAEQSWTALARQLQMMSDSVIKRHDLKTYWSDVHRCFGRYDVRENCFDTKNNFVWLSSQGEGLVHCEICSDECPPVPSIPLFRRLQGTPHSGHLAFEDGSELDVEFKCWGEYRLALGPADKVERVKGLIEFRTFLTATEVTGEKEAWSHKPEITFDNPHTDGWDTIHKAIIEEEEFPLIEVNFDKSPEPRVAEHSYFDWAEISAGHLRNLLDEDSVLELAPDRLRGTWLNAPTPTRFPASTIPDCIQGQLWSGDLERDLDAVCFDLKAKFYVFQKEMRDLAQNTEAVAEARWTTIVETEKTQ